MTITELKDRAYANATEHGFHHENQNIAEMLMLIVSELSEALEADRCCLRFSQEHKAFLDGYANETESEKIKPFGSLMFESNIKDTFEDELADAVIRVADLCGYLGIDLEAHIKAKMRYNASRPHKHGKRY